MAFWDQEEDIITVEKNSMDTIVAKSCKRNGKDYIDIRISHTNKDGVSSPTSGGVAIPLSQWKTLSDAINKHLTLE